MRPKLSLTSQISAVDSAINPTADLINNNSRRDLHHKHLEEVKRSLRFLQKHHDVIVAAVERSTAT